MRILYITPISPWPPDLGMRMRNSGVLSLLAKRHEVVVALASDSPQEIALFGNARAAVNNRIVLDPNSVSIGSRIIRHTLERYRPRRILHADNYGLFGDSLARLIEQIRPDLVWFFRFESAWRTACGRLSAPVVADMDDLESRANARAISSMRGFRRLLASADYYWFVRSQRNVAKYCDVVLVANPRDAEEAAIVTGKEVLALPNAFDYSVAPDDHAPRLRRAIFIGALAYKPNREGLGWFIRKVWPLIRAQVPDARLDIGGRQVA